MITPEAAALIAQLESTGRVVIPVKPGKALIQARLLPWLALLPLAIGAGGAFGAVKPGLEWQKVAFMALFGAIAVILLVSGLMLGRRWRRMAEDAKPLEVDFEGATAYALVMSPSEEPVRFPWATTLRVGFSSPGRGRSLATPVEIADIRPILARGPAAAREELVGTRLVREIERPRRRIPDVYEADPRAVHELLEHARRRGWQRLVGEASRMVPGYPPQAWGELAAAVGPEAGELG